MKKKIINSILGLPTLALIVLGFIFMISYAGKDQTLFFVFLVMHVFGWIIISVTESLFLYSKNTKQGK